MLIDGIPSLTNRELLILSDNVADAYHFSTMFDDRSLTPVFLSLLALCNCERVARALSPRHASHPVTAVARQGQPQRRPAPVRRKASRLSTH
jgi:hypothetical protein